jgi:hypothetical protein
LIVGLQIDLHKQVSIIAPSARMARFSGILHDRAMPATTSAPLAVPSSDANALQHPVPRFGVVDDNGAATVVGRGIDRDGGLEVQRLRCRVRSRTACASGE